MYLSILVDFNSNYYLELITLSNTTVTKEQGTWGGLYNVFLQY